MYEIWVQSKTVWGPIPAYGPYHAALLFFERNPLETEVTVKDAFVILTVSKVSSRLEACSGDDATSRQLRVIPFNHDTFQERAKEEREHCERIRDFAKREVESE